MRYWEWIEQEAETWRREQEEERRARFLPALESRNGETQTKEE